MERERKFIDKLLNIAPGGFYGILSLIARISGDLLAYLFFPGYSIFDNMVSDLGVGPGGIFFSLGLIISGIICIPFYVSLSRSLKGDRINEKTIKWGLIFFYISDIAYILVGFFPSLENNFFIYTTHGVLAVTSWLTGIVYLIIFSKLMLKNNNYSKLPAYSGFCLVGFLLVFLFTWIPILEWVMTFAFIAWLMNISCYMRYNKLDRIY
ncbi:MAG: DUF998 domain-containing protein [Promethearchaeota archaeon]